MGTKNDFIEMREREANLMPSRIDFETQLKEKADRIINGYESAVKSAVFIKKAEDAIKVFKEKIKEYVIDEIENGENTVDNVRLEVTSSGRYDYSSNPDYVELKNKLKEIEKDMQHAYKSGKSLINEETGEIIPPAKFIPNKKSYKIIKNGNL